MKTKRLPQVVRLAISGLLCASILLPLASHAGGIPLYQISSMANQAMAMSPVKPVPLTALPGGSAVMPVAMAGMPTAMGLASKLHQIFNQLPSLPALPNTAALPAALPTGALPAVGSLPGAGALPMALPSKLPSAAAMPGLGSLNMNASGRTGLPAS